MEVRVVYIHIYFNWNPIQNSTFKLYYIYVYDCTLSRARPVRLTGTNVKTTTAASTPAV